jgi:hypothetical protein
MMNAPADDEGTVSDLIKAYGRMLGFMPPAECEAGIGDNQTLLARHSAILLGHLRDHSESGE